MNTILIPYLHDHIELHVEEKNLKAVLLPREWHAPEDKTEQTLILDALRNPIGSTPLSELAKGKRRVVRCRCGSNNWNNDGRWLGEYCCASCGQYIQVFEKKD